MSEDEKNEQKGAAVTEYQEAKVDLAHIEKKIEKVFAAYRLAGETMDSRQGTTSEPKIKDGKVVFGWSNNVVASDLLNAQELAPLVLERDNARARLAAAKKCLSDLGLTGIS